MLKNHMFLKNEDDQLNYGNGSSSQGNNTIGNNYVLNNNGQNINSVINERNLNSVNSNSSTNEDEDFARKLQEEEDRLTALSLK